MQPIPAPFSDLFPKALQGSRPWWRVAAPDRQRPESRLKYVRSDQRVLYYTLHKDDRHWLRHICDVDTCAEGAAVTREENGAWVYLGHPGSVEKAFALVDEKYPLPPPELSDGQLWLLEAQNAILGPYTLHFGWDRPTRLGGRDFEYAALRALLFRGEEDVVEISTLGEVYAVPSRVRRYNTFLLHDPLRPGLVWSSSCRRTS